MYTKSYEYGYKPIFWGTAYHESIKHNLRHKILRGKFWLFPLPLVTGTKQFNLLLMFGEQCVPMEQQFHRISVLLVCLIIGIGAYFSVFESSIVHCFF